MSSTINRLSLKHPDVITPDEALLSTSVLDESNIIDEEEMEEDSEYIDPFLLMKEVPRYSLIPKYRLKHDLLPPKSPDVPSHTLILDLDETLVHCYLDKPEKYDISFQIEEEESYIVYLCFRPYVFHFLETMSKYYELVVFSAGIKPYVKTICNLFNHEKRLIQYSLCRDDCVLVGNGMYIKDLGALNRDLATTVILDNSPYTFAYHVDNGAPIDSWYCDKNDKKLYQYLPLLKLLSREDDVRVSLRSVFNIQGILDSYDDFYCVC
ncbi:hypothetical protein WA171_007244 [Blastocystis sp. BT1]